MQIQALPPAIKRRSEQLEMPVLYREACRALELCATMDEGKYYADKADALAAWAKIYGSDEDSKAAARLKLRAYARMGQLAGELQPGHKKVFGRGTDPGPQQLLMQHGLTKNHASAARALSKLDKEKLEDLVNSDNPRSPRATYHHSLVITNKSVMWAKCFPYLSQFRSFCRRHSAKEAVSLNAEDVIQARAILDEISIWLDTFEQALPK